jgi:hypothetical protein
MKVFADKYSTSTLRGEHAIQASQIYHLAGRLFPENANE